MKKRTLTLLLAPILSMLCSCSVIGAADFTNFRKQHAITKVGKNFSLVNRQVKQDPLTVEGDFYKINATTYASLLTNKTIKARSLKQFVIGNNSFYESQEYNGSYFDAFGDEIKYKLPTNSPQTATVYVAVAENSSFYKYVSGRKSSSTKIHFLECTQFKVNKIDYNADYAFIVKEAGDTHFHARNIFFDDNVKFNFRQNSYRITPDNIIKLNNSEYIIGNEHVFFSRFKSKDDEEQETIKSEYNSLVVRDKRIVRNDADFECILQIPFAGSSYDYQYFIKEVSPSDNYTFYSKEKYYYAYEYANGVSYEVDFLPIPDQVKMSADNEEAYIKCKKIKDQEISKGDFTIKVNYNGERSSLSSDTSIFTEDNPYYYFHNGYHELSDNTNILLLDKNVIVVDNGRENIMVANDGYNVSLTNYAPIQDEKGYTYSFEDTYWFATNSYKGTKLAYYDKSYGDIDVIQNSRVINLPNCLFATGNNIYYYDMRICSTSEFSNDYHFSEFVDFGKTTKVSIINTNKNGYVFHLSENKK